MTSAPSRRRCAARPRCRARRARPAHVAAGRATATARAAPARARAQRRRRRGGRARRAGSRRRRRRARRRPAAGPPPARRRLPDRGAARSARSHARRGGVAALERFVVQSVARRTALRAGDPRARPQLRRLRPGAAARRCSARCRRAPVARAILAFTHAGPAHGGDGATLVLLRKKKSHMSAKAAPLSRAKRFHQRYAPFIALAIGCATRVWSHHGVDFAPKAVALVALAWMLPFALARWTRARRPQEEERPPDVRAAAGRAGQHHAGDRAVPQRALLPGPDLVRVGDDSRRSTSPSRCCSRRWRSTRASIARIARRCSSARRCAPSGAS